MKNKLFLGFALPLLSQAIFCMDILHISQNSSSISINKTPLTTEIKQEKLFSEFIECANDFIAFYRFYRDINDRGDLPPTFAPELSNISGILNRILEINTTFPDIDEKYFASSVTTIIDKIEKKELSEESIQFLKDSVPSLSTSLKNITQSLLTFEPLFTKLDNNHSPQLARLNEICGTNLNNVVIVNSGKLKFLEESSLRSEINNIEYFPQECLSDPKFIEMCKDLDPNIKIVNDSVPEYNQLTNQIKLPPKATSTKLHVSDFGGKLPLEHDIIGAIYPTPEEAKFYHEFRHASVITQATILKILGKENTMELCSYLFNFNEEMQHKFRYKLTQLKQAMPGIEKFIKTLEELPFRQHVSLRMFNDFDDILQILGIAVVGNTLYIDRNSDMFFFSARNLPLRVDHLVALTTSKTSFVATLNFSLIEFQRFLTRFC